MMPCRPGYTSILVESFRCNEPRHRYPIEIRPLPDQPFSSNLYVQCSMEMRTEYPVGTVFRICARPRRKLGGRLHLGSPWQWPFEVVRLGPEGEPNGRPGVLINKRSVYMGCGFSPQMAPLFPQRE